MTAVQRRSARQSAPIGLWIDAPAAANLGNIRAILFSFEIGRFESSARRKFDYKQSFVGRGDRRPADGETGRRVDAAKLAKG